MISRLETRRFVLIRAAALGAVLACGHTAGDSLHPNYAWWITARFTPASDTIFSLPVGSVDSSWSKATIVTRDILPPQYRDDPSQLADSTFGFCFEGDFNRDGKKDLAAVGVYQTHQGNVGWFFLILTQDDSGRWRTAFLDAVRGRYGFRVLSMASGGQLRSSPCMECDGGSNVIWTGDRYLLKGIAGESEESEAGPDTTSP